MLLIHEELYMAGIVDKVYLLRLHSVKTISMGALISISSLLKSQAVAHSMLKQPTNLRHVLCGAAC